MRDIKHLECSASGMSASVMSSGRDCVEFVPVVVGSISSRAAGPPSLKYGTLSCYFFKQFETLNTNIN